MPFAEIILALALVGIVAWFINARDGVTGPVRITMNVVMMLIVVGIALGLIDSYIPMASGIRTILNIVVFLATCVGVLQAFGLWSGFVKFWSDLRANITGHHAPRL